MSTQQRSRRPEHHRGEKTATPDSAELLDLFGDEYTRRVFEAVADEPRCGRDVAAAADVSRATAYRRLNALRDLGLVEGRLAVDDDGHHRERFEAVAETLAVSIDDGVLDATVRVDAER